jgi:hypothetical protein
MAEPAARTRERETRLDVRASDGSPFLAATLALLPEEGRSLPKAVSDDVFNRSSSAERHVSPTR